MPNRDLRRGRDRSASPCAGARARRPSRRRRPPPAGLRRHRVVVEDEVDVEGGVELGQEARGCRRGSSRSRTARRTARRRRCAPPRGAPADRVGEARRVSTPTTTVLSVGVIAIAASAISIRSSRSSRAPRPCCRAGCNRRRRAACDRAGAESSRGRNGRRGTASGSRAARHGCSSPRATFGRGQLGKPERRRGQGRRHLGQRTVDEALPTATAAAPARGTRPRRAHRRRPSAPGARPGNGPSRSRT